MKKIFSIYILPVIMVVLIIIVWQSAEFLKKYMFTLSGIFEKKLPFTVNPIMKGGDVALIIPDEFNDNKNNNIPSNQSFKNTYDSTDILSYKLFYPIKNFENKYIWNMEIEFKRFDINIDNPNEFGLIKGVIYIDIVPDAGSNTPYYSSENIAFDKKFYWDYFVEFDYLHKEGKLLSFETKKTYPVRIIFYKKRNSIRLELPVVEKIDVKMKKESMGTYIVAAGLYSTFENGGLMSLKNNITPYYDFVCLSSKQDNDKLIINPVDIAKYNDVKGLPDLNGVIDNLTRISKEDFQSFYGDIEDNELNEAKKLYDSDKLEEAETIFLKYKNDVSIANTYIGVIQAKKAGKIKNLNAKIDAVYNAFEYYDKAEKLAKNDNDLYLLLANRIGVSTAIPDEIFHKLDLAEDDLNRFLKLDKLTRQEKAAYYLQLIGLLKNKNKIRELRFVIEDIKNIID